MDPTTQIQADLIKYLITIATNPNTGQTRTQAAITQATQLDTTMTINCLLSLVQDLGERLKQEGVDWRQGGTVWPL